MKSSYMLSVVTLVLASTLAGCKGAVVIIPAPRCGNEAVEVCHSYRDYWGRWRRECHIEYRRRCWDRYDALKAPVGPVALATEFGISVDAADRLIDVAADVNQGDVTKLREMGVSDADLLKMSTYELPSDEGLDAIAKSAGQDVEATRNLLSTILSESKKNVEEIKN